MDRDDGFESTMCCVHCGSSIHEVYVQYSPGNIRLTKCSKCKCVADEYVECEMMIILIDLILHKSEAYRHLFFNDANLNQQNIKDIIWKTGLFFILLESCRKSLIGSEIVDMIKWDSFSSFILTSGKLVGLVSLHNAVFFLTILMISRFVTKDESHPIPRADEFLKDAYAHVETGKILWDGFHKSSMYTHVVFADARRWMDILLALLLSSYFKLFTFAMMVWEFSPVMVHIVEMFVLSSNTIALKAATIISAGALARVLIGTLLQYCG